MLETRVGGYPTPRAEVTTFSVQTLDHIKHFAYQFPVSMVENGGVKQATRKCMDCITTVSS